MPNTLRRMVRWTRNRAGNWLRTGSRPLASTPSFSYDLEPEARAAIARIRPYSMVADEALITLYQQVAHCERQHIPGALVECGVWKGGSVGLMALASLRFGEGRRDLHLFDSFEGIPEPIAEVDGAKAVRVVRGARNATGKLRVAWDYAERGGPGSEAESRRLLGSLGYDLLRVHIHKGWFQETVPRDATGIGPIALLRLDGDWYDSTRVCLAHLCSQVTPGGFVVVDDYGCYEGCRRAADEFLSTKAPAPFLHHVNRDVRYWVNGG